MLWVKAFHIIGVVCWFSGIFYLPRLFVYHAMSEDQLSKDRFVIMERRGFEYIRRPSEVLEVRRGEWRRIGSDGNCMGGWGMEAKRGLVVRGRG
mgnify:CR=1 FL=1